MIIEFDKNPSLTTDQKLQSLQESVQMALNDVETKEAQVSERVASSNAEIQDINNDISDINEDISTIKSKLTVTTPSISITTSTGTLVATYIRKQGNVVQLRLTVRNSSSVASVENVFTGTINTAALRPVIGVTGAGYFGAHCIGGMIDNAGAITIRNASSTAVSITGTNSTTVSFTYIVA